MLALLAACGPTAEQQRAMDQQTCGGFGFMPGTDGFATCMMNTAHKREAEEAADRRALQERQAREAEARAAAADSAGTTKPSSEGFVDTSPPRTAKCTSTSTQVGDTTTTHEDCHW